MKRSLYTLLSFSLCHQCLSCISCNQKIQEGIYNSRFYPNLLTMLSAFIVLAIIIAVLSYLALLKLPTSQQRRYPKLASLVPLGAASLIIGIGIGGFTDGIVLHQLLQWHEMLSAKIAANTYEGKSINMFWDGIFHAFTLLVTLTGIILMWRLLKKKNEFNTSGYLMSGGVFCGWALFNFTEGIIDHHLLGLHNVRETVTDPNKWNYNFLLISALLLIIGILLIKQSVKKKPLNFIIRI